MMYKYTPPDIKTASGVYEAACFGIDAIYYCNASMLASIDPCRAVNVVEDDTFVYPSQRHEPFWWGVESAVRAVIDLAEGQTKEIARTTGEASDGQWKRVYSGLSRRVLYWRYKVAREAILGAEESEDPAMITPFPIRDGTKKALCSAGIQSLSEIERFSYKDLMGIKGVGRERAEELYVVLAKHNAIMRATQE